MKTGAQIEDVVKEGLVEDIFRMERAYALLQATGNRVVEINDVQRGNFGELFGASDTQHDA